MEVEVFFGGDFARMEEAWGIRRQVFVEEQGVAVTDEMDGHDQDALAQLLVRSADGTALGTLRIMHAGDPRVIKIQRVAVLPEGRRGGYGTALMRRAEAFGREQGYLAAELDSQLIAQRFYTVLGYVPDGEVFLDAGIEHIHMTLVL